MVEICLLATPPRTNREKGEDNMLRGKLIIKNVMSNSICPEVTLLVKLMGAQESPQRACR
jgi:hypothetical protein